MTTNKLWRYAINTFEVNTRESNVKMLSLSTDTHAKLQAEQTNPAIAAILLVYEPVFFAYRDLCQQYGVKSGEYQGTTLGFEQYLDQIPLNLRIWESAIRAVYIEDSEEEKAIFPNKRTPFLTGTYESRLNALGALKLKTAADPALAAVNTLITSFYNAATGARLVQQTNEGALKQLSDLRENQRVILAGELAGVQGQLMFIHRQNLREIQRYFDLSLLTDAGDDEPIIFSGNIAANTIISLDDISGPGFNVVPGMRVLLKNTSTNAATLIFFAANNPADPPGSGPQFSLAPGQSVEKTIEELGYGAYSDFNLQNTSAFEGTWEIEILD